MFCDLADSTTLSGQLDPEDLRAVLRAYQQTCAESIQRYEGHIAQYLGDGLLVYFGWPQAHEDDAQRAVHAGTGILTAMQRLNTRLAGTPHARLECRSSPYYHDSALYPLMDLLQRALHAPSSDGTQEPHVCLEKLLEQYSLATAETVPLLARLLSLPLPDGCYPPPTMSPQQQRQKTLEALLAFVLAQAVQQPVLFILEDLHWTDPSTLE
jgi:predicted ATPase